MKYALQLGPFRQANVWLDEPPPVSFEASSFVSEQILKKEGECPVQRQIAGVELCFYVEPFLYALLGAELVDSDGEGSEIRLSILNDGVLYSGSLRGEWEEVRTGLPIDFAQAVLTGVKKGLENVAIPPGRNLWFRWAANGAFSSCEYIFGVAAEIVTRLLLLPTTARSDEVQRIVEQGHHR